MTITTNQPTHANTAGRVQLRRSPAFAKLAAALVLFVGAGPSFAATSSVTKIIRIQAGGAAFYIRLQPTATLTLTCPGAGGGASNFAAGQLAEMFPLDEGAKAKLAVALEAFAMGRDIFFTASTCSSGTSGYPLIDYLYMQ